MTSRATFPRFDNTPMTPPNAVHAIALPSPRGVTSQMNTLSVTFLDWTVFNSPNNNKLRIVGRLGSQTLTTNTLTPIKDVASPIDQTFFFPWDSTQTQLKIAVQQDTENSSSTSGSSSLCRATVYLQAHYYSLGGVREYIELFDRNKKSWGTIFLHTEFLACKERLRVAKVKPDWAQVCRRNDAASPVQRRKSPLDAAPAKDETFDAAYPFNGVRVYCYLGAGWKKLKNKAVNVVVGLGGIGLKCTESFPVTYKGDFKVARVFEFPFQRERRIKILIQDSGSGHLLGEGIYDTLDLVNGNVVTCKQRLAFYDPDVGGKQQGFMEVLTEFCPNRLQKEVRKMGESPLTGHSFGSGSSPSSTPFPGSPVEAKEGDITSLTGLVEAQVSSGNTKDTLKFSPFSDMKTLLIQILAVTDLPSINDCCTVQVCLGWYRSATGNYHHVRSDLRSGIFELHRIPYAKQRFAKIVLRVADAMGGAREAVSWLDLSLIGSTTNIRAQLLMGNGDNYLGRVHMRMEFIPDVLEASTPLRVEKEDIVQKTSLSTIVRQHETKSAVHMRSKSPPFIRPLALSNLCVSSPLISPRARSDSKGKSDAVLENFLFESVTPAAAEPHPSLDCDFILLQLVGFRNLPDLDGLRLLKLQLVLRVGPRVTFTTHVLDTSDTDPTFNALVFRLPMMELRFLTIDVFERTMTYKPYYLGRVVIDTASVRPGDATATYEQLTGLSGSTYCLYALENVTNMDPPTRSTPQATLVRNLKEDDLPLSKYMRIAQDGGDHASTRDSEEMSSTHVLAKSTFCVKLRALQGMISPFPFSNIDVYVQVEYGDVSVTSAPISIDVNKHTTINQMVKLPKTASPWGMLRFRLLAGCPVRRPEKQLECDISISSTHLQETMVQFDNSETKLFVTLSEINEPCRIGGCESICANQAESYFPSLVSA